ncbi:hypothetical protein DSM04_105236 [Leeuwenhoekiella aestuarii]|uniref:Uncharacterized protein n=1 Tax=Leeuwenhoekiella aestuarii TaxID=2249426 RepID=A0A4Q0NTS7_9FLAO|nr:hypothetical protein DSM04_105236 [Leeuwenhoekiella aestuarii]
MNPIQELDEFYNKLEGLCESWNPLKNKFSQF